MSLKSIHDTRRPVQKSPFFAPAPPKSHILTSPGGTTISKIKDVDDAPKSSVPGAAFNLINAIVGAGIVGMPFAIQQCSLVLGVGMILFFAMVTLKTVRLLIETAKHVDVSTYERLAEVSFGKRGFTVISLAMFVMSYGAMVGYMMIIKNNLSYLLGVSDDNVYVQRAVLTISSLMIMLPLSMNRDMSALSKTSSISVIFDGILVGIVACFSPFRSSVKEAGGLLEVMQTSQPDIRTFFIGIGVLCFAFVCQHSAFIIAASLENPTRQRWNAVTGIALSVCAVLASIMGVAGFLGFLQDTDGDILVNLGRAASVGSDAMQTASDLARGLLCITMFFVYPMELFVARHVCVVLFFKGRRAHEGDDHSVLSRRDRRVAITLALYIVSLAPALLFTDLGSVFSVTGSLGGAILSYVGPGITFIAVHGDEFLMLASYRWSNVPGVLVQNTTTSQETKPTSVLNRDVEANSNSKPLESSTRKEKHIIIQIYDDICWYIYLMPLWCKIANHGKKMLKEHRDAEALKSPFPMALGRIIHQNHPMKHRLHDVIKPNIVDNDDWEERKPLVRQNSLQEHHRLQKMGLPNSPKLAPIQLTKTRFNDTIETNNSTYGSMKPNIQVSSNKDIINHTKRIQSLDDCQSTVSLLTKMRQKGHVITTITTNAIENGEIDPQDETPTSFDFILAAFYILFGFVAASAGLFSAFFL